MPTKISAPTKRLALEKLRAGLTIKEVADMTGVSPRTLDRWKAGAVQKASMPARKAATPTPAPSVVEPMSQNSIDEEASAALDFQESPSPIGEKKSIIDQGMDSLKGLLGIGEREEKKVPVAPLVAKLDAKRQAFVDNVTPTISLAFTLAAAWAWGSIGDEYKALAPDEPTATRIIEPLVRIYARHASFLTDVNPDVADAGASLVALIGYAYTSLGVYQHIKAEKEAHEQDGNITNFPRQYRSSDASESRASYQGGGLATVSGASGDYGSVDGSNGGYTPGVSRANLSDKEARQLEALSRLSAKDYQSRARRSGRI